MVRQGSLSVSIIRGNPVRRGRRPDAVPRFSGIDENPRASVSLEIANLQRSFYSVFGFLLLIKSAVHLWIPNPIWKSLRPSLLLRWASTSIACRPTEIDPTFDMIRPARLHSNFPCAFWSGDGNLAVGVVLAVLLLLPNRDPVQQQHRRDEVSSSLGKSESSVSGSQQMVITCERSATTFQFALMPATPPELTTPMAHLWSGPISDSYLLLQWWLDLCGIPWDQQQLSLFFDRA